jgi:hypothetical protein
MELDSPRGRALATIKLAVFLDMIGVGIFVPMLSYYWNELGVRTEFLGLVSSAYNIAQIVSGIVLGYVSDHLLGRKNVLLLSFGGSAVSYALAGMAYQSNTMLWLVLSRIIVGLVKQTMTISRAITVCLQPDDLKRTTALSHLRAGAQFSCFTSTKVQLLTRWGGSTHTRRSHHAGVDAGSNYRRPAQQVLQQGTPMRCLRTLLPRSPPSASDLTTDFTTDFTTEFTTEFLLTLLLTLLAGGACVRGFRALCL